MPVLVSFAVAACAAPGRSGAADPHAPATAARTQVVRPAQFRAAEIVPAPPLVQISATTDASNRLPREVRDRVTRLVRQRVAAVGSRASRRFVVAPAVTRIEIVGGPEITIDCSVAVRVTPAGDHGDEQWEADQTATATGSATATAGGHPQQIARSLEDCVTAAADEIVARHVVPFLARAIARR